MSTTTPPTRPGLLAEVQAFLQREWPGATLEDGYEVVSMNAPVVRRYWAPGDRYLAQLPARRALFDLLFGSSTRLWMVSLNFDPRPFVRGPAPFDLRSTWTTPGWHGDVAHEVIAVETSPGAVDVDAILKAVALTAAIAVTFIDPDRRRGLRPGTATTPAFVLASSEADLAPLAGQLPEGQWF